MIAWLLDPADQFAARPARDGEPDDVYFEESEDRYAIAWIGDYRVDGNAFSFIDRDTGRFNTILGYLPEGSNRSVRKFQICLAGSVADKT